MINKSLLCCALAACSLTSAHAVSIEVYGLVDYGFSLSRTSGNADNAIHNSWSFEMKSGMRNSSRVGFRGTEDLGNGYKVHFVLENQFLADTGALQDSSSFFARESSVALSGPFGKLTLGKVGKLRSPVGTTALASTITNPFGSAMSDFVGGTKSVTSGDYLTINNAVTYASPDMAGLKLYAQYSFANTNETGYVDGDDRYMALGARYSNGPLLLTGIVDTVNLKHQHDNGEQPTTVTLLGSYDFGFLKPYAFIHYFENGTINAMGGYIRANSADTYDGIGAGLSLQWPIGNGRAKVGVGYMDAEYSDSPIKNDVTRYTVQAGYDYVLTKRTHLYTDIGFAQQDQETNEGKTNLKGCEVLAGMVHYF